MSPIRHAAILILFAAMTTSVALAEDAPSTPEDVLDQALRSLAAHSQNARVKMRNGTRGFATGPGGAPTTKQDISKGGRVGIDGRPETVPGAGKPSWCCGANIEQMRKDLGTIEAVLVEYARRLDGDETAREHLVAMYGQWKAAGEALQVFQVSDSIAVAEQAIGDVRSATGVIREEHDALVACCLSRARPNQQARGAGQ